MGQRVRTLLRGPAALLVAFGIAAALTAIGRQLHASAGNGADRAALQAVPRVAGTGTYVDPRTAVRVTLSSAVALPGRNPSARGSISLLVRATVGNRGAGTRHYDNRNFYAVARSGEAYAADVRARSFPELGRGRLRPRAARAGWIGFAVPAGGGRYEVIWNDDNRLVPPAVLETVAVRGR